MAYFGTNAYPEKGKEKEGIYERHVEKDNVDHWGWSHTQALNSHQSYSRIL